MKKTVFAAALVGALSGCASSPYAPPVTTAMGMSEDESRIQLTAMTSGTIVQEAGCLRIKAANGSYALVWPFGSRIASTGTVALPNGKSVKVGESLRLGGGLRDTLPSSLTGRTGAMCSGPYWIVADRIDA